MAAIPWVDAAAKEWGRYMRRPVDGWPNVSLMGRIREEGAVGAAIKQHSNKIPVYGMSKSVADLNRLIKLLSEQKRNVMWVHYVLVAPLKTKYELIGLGKSCYYELRDSAHNQIDLMDKKTSGKTGRIEYFHAIKA